MTVGLPGTGIGGIFYILLCVSMPIVELFKSVRRQSSFKRWGFVILQVSLVAGIFIGIWGEVWCMRGAIAWIQKTFGIQLVSGGELKHLTLGMVRALSFAAAFGSFLSLAIVYGLVHLLRVMVHNEEEIKARVTAIKKTAAAVLNTATARATANLAPFIRALVLLQKNFIRFFRVAALSKR
jgi:hypothetical protein